VIGAWQLASGRFVATRPLKDLRVPQGPNVMTPHPVTGSYVAIYWVLAGHHEEWNRRAVDQVNWLHANGRMFNERDHIHPLPYNYEWGVQRDPDGVSAELALDHPISSGSCAMLSARPSYTHVDRALSRATGRSRRSAGLLAEALDDHGHTLAAAHAHRLEPDALASVFEAVEQCGHDAGAGHAERVA
jgi:hypothetical protein